LAARCIKALYVCTGMPVGTGLPGRVKTMEAIVSAQQKNRTYGLGESFMRERHSVRINLAPERPAEWFSHSLAGWGLLACQRIHPAP
jgi:hypothetical protein